MIMLFIIRPRDQSIFGVNGRFNHHRLILNHQRLIPNQSIFGLVFWASPLGFSLWLEMGPKETNKTLAPMGLGLICQLLISPKLPLIMFNATI